jgi:hypothetical protein
MQRGKPGEGRELAPLQSMLAVPRELFDMLVLLEGTPQWLNESDRSLE